MPEAAQQSHGNDKPGMLAGVTVIELGDETAEYSGLLLAGMGATVLKIEPPGGCQSRRLPPFEGDREDPEKSLFFWAYNRGKRSVVIDTELAEGREQLLRLLNRADILLEATAGRLETILGIGREALAEKYPSLIVARMTPFGDTGPWKNFRANDLIHMALGGVMSNCGYDPDLSGKYDVPPISPQFWQSYHIAGEQLVVGTLAALMSRARTGKGQEVSCAVHEAVSKNTELDVMSWIMRHAPVNRQTCRHALERTDRIPTICHTKDGRWYMTGMSQEETKLIPFLHSYGVAGELEVIPGEQQKGRRVPGSSANSARGMQLIEAVQRLIRACTFENVPWQAAQEAGLLWAPLRKPHENLADPHWVKRGSLGEVDHPERDQPLCYPVSKWRSDRTQWVAGNRAPSLGEHTAEALRAAPSRIAAEPIREKATAASPLLSKRGFPFALQNIRILDFSWFLASAGGTRFLAALGAESLKVEWKAHPDTRLAAMAPVGGREARRLAKVPLEGVTDSDMGGQFLNKNSGKRGLSLNIRDPRGLEIAKRLVQMSDVVAEGFSPGVLERAGLGYDVMKSLRPDIIYIQQSGMGAYGAYGRFRTVGPVAAAFTGASEMSGLPEPAMPAGWGYSYLDWIGAYSFASAILGALYHREKTGEGQWIDASQCESGLFLNAVAMLDWQVNHRSFRRSGNRPPWQMLAPHGAYRCEGDDRWIAIVCQNDDDWRRLVKVSGKAEWLADPRFATLAGRIANQDALDAAINSWTSTQEAYACMNLLQAAGVAAGVVQNAEDRCDHDPQLAALNWLTEIKGTKIGTWPVPELPMKLSETPAYIGGPIDRGAPCYGEDNTYILREMLGFSDTEIAKLAAEDVI
jgi:crotonobetainyl-CoA:carnitine CoA-transferase CaiB-like acyl-CoA transferase